MIYYLPSPFLSLILFVIVLLCVPFPSTTDYFCFTIHFFFLLCLCAIKHFQSILTSGPYTCPPFGMDNFEGLRTLPRDPEQLRHHLSRINHVLKKRYNIDAPECVLRADSTADFYEYYKKEVCRVISHLNQSTKRNYKVRVDPQRLARGMEIRASDGAGSPSPSQSQNSYCDPNWASALVEKSQLMQQQQAVEEHRQKVGAAAADYIIATPKNKTFPEEDNFLSTAAVESEKRRQKENNTCLFSTPPQFNGFAVSPQ
ncbi:chromosomal passenger protein [Strigomonas culicis]|uniref:Chromosomal passenger protein n=1 Tax=Strigomonas culicis TaxID=28005 RepID=S9U4Y1_9TRYP|nr:chromosomal passenger protein [Strigomonas culicis]|eukprot:EPY25867.1 chromosomal passenger protein [Strigomonas culicis]